MIVGVLIRGPEGRGPGHQVAWVAPSLDCEPKCRVPRTNGRSGLGQTQVTSQLSGEIVGYHSGSPGSRRNPVVLFANILANDLQLD